MSQKLATLILLFIACCGCNKNTNELPVVPPGPQPVVPDSLSKLLSVGNLGIVRMNLYRYKGQVGDSVRIRLFNLTTQDITDLSLLSELAGQLPLNFDNCNQFRHITGLQLKANADTGFLFSRNSTLMLADSLMHTGILSWNANGHRWAGYYGNLNAYSYFIRDTINTSLNFYGYLRGYIEADGSTTFRMKAVGNTYYNVYGSFLPGNTFQGFLETNGRSPDVMLDSFTVGTARVLSDTAGNQVRLRLRLKDSLANGVKAIDLYLKK